MNRRLSIPLLVTVLLAASFGAPRTVAAGSPVAVDDPAVPTCMPDTRFGGAMPIPEDWGQFVFAYECSAIANDTDAGGTIVAWQIDTLPAHGTLEWLPSVPGIFGYTPDPNFSTPSGDWISDSITYHVIDDADVSSNEATYRFWVVPVNDAPTLTPGSFVESAEDTPFSAPWATDVSAGPNEADQTVHFELRQTLSISNPPLTFTSQPAISADGTLSYTPAPNSWGNIRLSFVAKDDGGLVDPAPGSQNPDPADTSAPFVVDITVTPVNDPPDAVDDFDTFQEDTSGGIFVRGNDTDVDGDNVSVISTTDGAKGTTAIEPGSSVVDYSPYPNAVGADSFTYTISDGHGGTDTATVHITITPAQDAPDAVDDVATIAEDAGPSAIDVLANDTDPDLDPLTITGTTDGAKGSVAITGGGSGLTYTPDANANGSDSFTYTIDDGNGGTDTATVQVTITATNDAPIAGNDVLLIDEDSPSTPIDVLANDSDVDSDALTVTAITPAAKGLVVIAEDGSGVSYQPFGNKFGSDTFTYTVEDDQGASTVASVTVTISPVEDPPVLEPDGLTSIIKVYIKGGAKTIPVLANDTYLPDAPQTLLITRVTQGALGTVSIANGGASLTYNPTGAGTGIDVFSYTVTDSGGGTATQNVQVTVAKDISRPVATVTSLTKASISGSSKLKLTVKWTLTDTGTGIKSQLLQRRTDSGSWITVSLPASTRSASFAMSRGHTYTFRIRGTDKAGNVGLFASRLIRI